MSTRDTPEPPATAPLEATPANAQAEVAREPDHSAEHASMGPILDDPVLSAGTPATETPSTGATEPTQAELQAQFKSELDRLIARVEETTDYKAPPFSPHALL